MSFNTTKLHRILISTPSFPPIILLQFHALFTFGRAKFWLLTKHNRFYRGCWQASNHVYTQTHSHGISPIINPQIHHPYLVHTKIIWYICSILKLTPPKLPSFAHTLLRFALQLWDINTHIVCTPPYTHSHAWTHTYRSSFKSHPKS